MNIKLSKASKGELLLGAVFVLLAILIGYYIFTQDKFENETGDE
jgi:hypothetical protein